MQLNQSLDCLSIPLEVHESLLVGCFERLPADERADGPGLLLLTARLAELTLLCAGNYADCAACSAAGDLLFNPRQIVVHFTDGSAAAVKDRHARISDQFRRPAETRSNLVFRMRRSAIPEERRPPIFSCIVRRLESSPLISPDYLARLRKKAEKAAAAIGFLAAWGITCPEAAWKMRHSLTGEKRSFFESNLCRFTPQTFQRLGDDFQRLSNGRPVQSAIFRRQPTPTRSAA